MNSCQSETRETRTTEVRTSSQREMEASIPFSEKSCSRPTGSFALSAPVKLSILSPLRKTMKVGMARMPTSWAISSSSSTSIFVTCILWKLQIACNRHGGAQKSFKRAVTEAMRWEREGETWHQVWLEV